MASSFSKSKGLQAEDLEPPRRPSGVIGDDSHKAEADRKLGMTRARIYSFGASTQGGGSHEEDMLRATAIDATRRRRPPRRCSTAGSAPRDLRPAVPGRREAGQDSVGDDKDGGSGSAGGGYGGVKGRYGNASSRVGSDNVNEDTTDSSEHLGIIDISKVRTKHGGKSGLKGRDSGRKTLASLREERVVCRYAQPIPWLRCFALAQRLLLVAENIGGVCAEVSCSTCVTFRKRWEEFVGESFINLASLAL